MNIPKGYQLAPIEPTDEMINAGQDQEFTVDVYAAMLAAAPTPPQPIYDEAKERELFEKILGSLMVGRFNGGGYKNIFIENQWLGWLACAQYRAKSVEVDHG